MKRTNIVIDEELIEKAMEITHARSKREVVQMALEQMVKKSSLASALKRLRGNLNWTGNVSKMRRRRI
jgi:Arc/MetJ family transcription regulator